MEPDRKDHTLRKVLLALGSVGFVGSALIVGFFLLVVPSRHCDIPPGGAIRRQRAIFTTSLGWTMAPTSKNGRNGGYAIIRTRLSIGCPVWDLLLGCRRQVRSSKSLLALQMSSKKGKVPNRGTDAPRVALVRSMGQACRKSRASLPGAGGAGPRIGASNRS